MTRNGASLSIGDLADATGRSVHALRYYEREGLIPLVERNAAGHRRYREEHVGWVGLIERLRASGMSIQRIREYATLARKGKGTARARKQLLEEHEAEIEHQIADLEDCRAIVRAKIDFYDGKVSNPREVWALIAEVRSRRDQRNRAGQPSTVEGEAT